MRKLQRTGGAGGAAAGGDGVKVELDEDGLALDALEAAAEAVRQAVREIERAGKAYALEAARQRLSQIVAEATYVRDAGVELLVSEAERFCETDGAGDVLGAGAAVALLGAAQQLADEGRARPDVEGADAFGTVELVRRQREEVDAEAVDVQVEGTGGLDGVGVEDDMAVVVLDKPGEVGDGSMAPTSLLAYMIETRVVSGRSACARSSGLTKPAASTGR